MRQNFKRRSDEARKPRIIAKATPKAAKAQAILALQIAFGAALVVALLR
ncbi:MAG: hypothetical protein OXC60_09160 [Litoreibacter sp.]|nr:hypothetical protein [Litoreibacter sp.]